MSNSELWRMKKQRVCALEVAERESLEKTKRQRARARPRSSRSLPLERHQPAARLSTLRALINTSLSLQQLSGAGGWLWQEGAEGRGHLHVFFATRAPP